MALNFRGSREHAAVSVAATRSEADNRTRVSRMGKCTTPPSTARSALGVEYRYQSDSPSANRSAQLASHGGVGRHGGALCDRRRLRAVVPGSRRGGVSTSDPRIVPRSPVGNLPPRDVRRDCAPGRAASVPENALDPPACLAPASGNGLRGVCVHHGGGRDVHGRIFLRRLDHTRRLRPARLLHP